MVNKEDYFKLGTDICKGVKKTEICIPYKPQQMSFFSRFFCGTRQYYVKQI